MTADRAVTAEGTVTADGLLAHVVVELERLRVDVAVAVPAGSTLAVLGPSGAGKTTLLRALAGLAPLAAGRTTLDGTVLDQPSAGVRVAPPERRVGVVFQDLLLFPHLSALDNVAFGLRARGVDRRHARRLAADRLERLGVAGVAHAHPGALSGGQAQRVALARALVTEPRLLLLDEPLTGLDAATRSEVRRDLASHLDRFDGAALVVTHEPLEAVALADRLLIVEDGRVTQAGTASEVTRQPRSGWAARLVGLNLYRGRATGVRLQVDGGGELTLASPLHGQAFAVVAPQAVALYRTAPAGSPRNVWPGRVSSLEAAGDRIRVAVDATPPVVAEVTPDAVVALDLVTGGPVWVAVKATEITAYPR